MEPLKNLLGLGGGYFGEERVENGEKEEYRKLDRKIFRILLIKKVLIFW